MIFIPKTSNKKKYITNKISLTVFLCLVLNITSCDNKNYCDELIRLADNKLVQAKLEKWVSEHVVNNKISHVNLTLGGGMWPGVYMLNKKFEWKVLNFEKDSQIRLVGPKASSWVDGKLIDIQSVFFGERSRFGILVRIPNSPSFGVNKKYLKYISKDFSVVCRKR